MRLPFPRSNPSSTTPLLPDGEAPPHVWWQGLVLPSAGSLSAAGNRNPMYPPTPGGKAPLASSAALSPDRTDARCAEEPASSACLCWCALRVKPPIGSVLTLRLQRQQNRCRSDTKVSRAFA